MSNINDGGGPAFPVSRVFSGLTMRDYFAAKAMMMFVEDLDPRPAAEMAYQYADAMLAFRAKDRA